MTDHDHYEELAALAAAGLLSDQKAAELYEHAKVCAECPKAEVEFSEIVRHGMPLTIGPVREFVDRMKTKPDQGVRIRFLERARQEGIEFSPEVQKASPQRARLGFAVAAAATATAIILLASYGPAVYRHAISQQSGQARQRIDQLQSQNVALAANVSQLNESLAAQQREIESLRTQLGTATRAADSLRHDNEQARGEAQGSSSRNVQLADELANSEKRLADARSEVAHINQLRTGDEASLLAQQVRIAELSDQLRIASATLDLERQLTGAGKDIRELLTARQLHVIDVRDTDVNGKPSKAFGRIFVTEGKSLTFYAFDLNEDQVINAKQRFEVWGSQQGKKSSQRLGFLYADNKADRRWALKVNDPGLIKEIDSVFVTLEPFTGGQTPSGQPMLYAYLGRPNHP